MLYVSCVMITHNCFQKHKGMFGSQLVLRTFAAYYSSMHGAAVKVSALKHKDKDPHGALSLSTASVSV